MGVIWDMDVRVTGNREKFQSDLNFSIQVEDVHNIPQIAELRRRFFKEFEDSDRGEDLRVLAPKVVKDKGKITENTSVNKSVAFDDGTVNNAGNSETIGSTGTVESYTELENPGDSLEDILKDISTNGVFGENRKSDNREGTMLDVGKINQSSEGTNLETGDISTFRESIKQKREGIVSSGERLELIGEEYNGFMKDTKQKLEGINQNSENKEDKEKNVKQTQEVNKSESGKIKNRNGIIYVEVKYDEDGWAYGGENVNEDEIEDYNSDEDFGNEDFDDFPTEDEFGDDDTFGYDDTSDDDTEDDFPDNDSDSDEEVDEEDDEEDFQDNEELDFDDDTDFPDEDESEDEDDFPDEDTGKDDVDFPEETTEDEGEETEDTEDDDPFSEWGNDFDEDEDNDDDDFSPMDSSDEVEDTDYNSSDSEASKNFLDIVKSKAKECTTNKDERKEKVIPINKGKTIDESWRKTSEVGDIDDLWSFDSMKDLSGDEFDNMLYGESELDKRCENCSDVEVPDVEAISKTREARKRVGNSKRGVDAVEIKEDTSKIEVDDDEEDIFGSLNFEDEEDDSESVDKDVTDEEDDDDIFGSLGFSEEDIDEDEAITKEVEKDIKDKGYSIDDFYQKGNKQSVTANIQKPKPSAKEVVKVEEKKEVNRGDYKTLRDFVKANKGCTVSEALVLFSKKEIEKDLKVGRVYQRRDKLFI